jgi:hypothetical protein
MAILAISEAARLASTEALPAPTGVAPLCDDVGPRAAYSRPAR